MQIGLYKTLSAILGSGLLIFLINHFKSIGKNRNQIYTNKRKIKRLDKCKMDQKRVEDRLDNIIQITESIQEDIKNLEKNTKSNTDDISKIKGILSQMSKDDETEGDKYPKW